MGDKYLNIQESLLKDINKDLLFANDNLKTSSKGIINQGNQIIKIQNKIDKSGDKI